MKVRVLHEAGFEEAMLGLSLSYGQEPHDMPPVAEKLLKKGGSHVKFLESINVWLDITAPRYWWAQADTYRIGTTKQSGSTMHTMTKRELTQDDFQGGIQVKALLDALNLHIRAKDWYWAKRHLPESFLQRRVVATNYKVLRHIIGQRLHHKLPEWQEFCLAVHDGVGFPEYLE